MTDRGARLLPRVSLEYRSSGQKGTHLDCCDVAIASACVGRQSMGASGIFVYEVRMRRTQHSLVRDPEYIGSTISRRLAS